jgi:hypothetical protein
VRHCNVNFVESSRLRFLDVPELNGSNVGAREEPLGEIYAVLLRHEVGRSKMREAWRAQKISSRISRIST